MKIQGVDIQGISFRDDGVVEFTFIEERDATKNGVIVRTLIADASEYPEKLGDLAEAAVELLDELIQAIQRPTLRP